jgi:hypothetical protein
VKPPGTRRVALSALLLTCLAAPARGQSAENPMLILTVSGGWITGGGMWRLPRQEEAVVGGALDTVGLERRFRTGLVLGVGATLFRSPHIGYTADLTFLGTATESRCMPPLQWAADANHVNEQACNNIQGQRIGTSVAAVGLGLTWRPVATGGIQPYLRGVAGPAYLGSSYVETSGTVTVPSDSLVIPYRVRTFLGDSHHRNWTWVATLSAGVMLRMSPGAQLRFEARDVVTNLPVATGPGNPLTADSPAQVARKVFHLPSFTVGLDIVLEQSQRPRRY